MKPKAEWSMGEMTSHQADWQGKEDKNAHVAAADTRGEGQGHVRKYMPVWDSVDGSTYGQSSPRKAW